MNRASKRSLREYIRAIAKKAKKNKVGSITLGVEVKNCKDCRRGDCTICSANQELEELYKLPNCRSCRKALECPHRPRHGAPMRINCHLWEDRESLRRSQARTMRNVMEDDTK